MKIRTKYLLVAVLIAGTLLLLKFFGYYSKEDKGFLGFCGRLLNATNSFDVKYKNIDSEKIDVIWRCDEGRDTLVRNGKIISNFGYEYGPEMFDIYYEGKPLCSHGLWSTNNNDPYQVEIRISRGDGTFEVIYRINEETKAILIDSSRQVVSSSTVKQL